jgi:hypothetical protein
MGIAWNPWTSVVCKLHGGSRWWGPTMVIAWNPWTYVVCKLHGGSMRFFQWVHYLNTHHVSKPQSEWLCKHCKEPDMFCHLWIEERQRLNRGGKTYLYVLNEGKDWIEEEKTHGSDQRWRLNRSKIEQKDDHGDFEICELMIAFWFHLHWQKYPQSYGGNSLTWCNGIQNPICTYCTDIGQATSLAAIPIEFRDFTTKTTCVGKHWMCTS